MPEIDLSVIGKKTDPVVFKYTWKDVVLYALGVGASADELSFVYENAPGGLKAVKTSTTPDFCTANIGYGCHARFRLKGKSSRSVK